MQITDHKSLPPVLALLLLSGSLASCAEVAGLEVAPDSVDFGRLAVGATGHRSVTVASREEAATVILVVQPVTGAFTLESPRTLALAAGTETEVVLVATSETDGEAQGALTLLWESGGMDIPLSARFEFDVVDADRDGFPSTVDCDDNDATVYPGADEIPGDGIDNDCDGVTDKGDDGGDDDDDRNPGPGGDDGYAVCVLDSNLTWSGGYDLDRVKGPPQ